MRTATIEQAAMALSECFASKYVLAVSRDDLSEVGLRFEIWEG
jgi:hypothetical protein